MLPLRPLLVLACVAGAAAQLQRSVLYSINWAQYRTGSVGGKQCQWQPKDLPAELATHINHAFASVGSDYSIKTVEWNDADLFAQYRALKQRNPKLKTLVSLGGWSFTDPGPTQRIFGDMVSSAANRAAFIRSALAFTAQHGFDGVDLDWEYPGAADRGGRSTDKSGLVALVRELRAAATAAGRPTFLVTMAVASCPYGCDGLDLPGLMPYVDFLNLMTYDYNGAWASRTGANAPWKDPLGGNDIASTLDYYLNRNRVPPQKLSLGLGLYGRGWTLRSAAPGAGLGAAAASLRAPVGACTQEAGYLAWYEIKNLIDQGATVKVDPITKSAWVQKGTTWISCDTPETLAMKIQAAKALGLGGIMAWDASMDDQQLTLMRLMQAYVNASDSQKGGGVPPTVPPATRPYTVQIVLAGFQPRLLTATHKLRLKAWILAFAGVPASTISVTATNNSVVLSWRSNRTVADMAARAQARFNTTRCPTPIILTHAKLIESKLAPLPVRTVGFNALGLQGIGNVRSYTLMAVNCSAPGKAPATAAEVAVAIADVKRMMLPPISSVTAARGTTPLAWFWRLRSAFGPPPSDQNATTPE
eukprot:scaffold10.g2354.t1